ncbi:MAG: IgGFc-binding protein [Pseudomonadota bacterium]
MKKNTISVAWAAALLLVCGCGTENSVKFDGTDTPTDTDFEEMHTPCTTEGDTRCFGSMFQECEDGVWVDKEDCAAGDLICNDDYGCVVCHPRQTYCVGPLLYQCNEDGTGGELIADCEEISGSTCDPATGSCVSLCDAAASERSNVGCVYWAVDLDNGENSIDNAAGAQFAVAVANVDTRHTATVTAQMDESAYGNPPATVEVEVADVDPGSIHIFNLPRRDIDGPNITEHTDDGPQSGLSSRAFKLTSTIPVVAYQFNPIVQAFTNDASLLIPESGIDTLYYVITLPPANPMPVPGLLPAPNRSYVTVVGTQENTTVSVIPSYDIEASIPPIPAGYAAVPAIRAGDIYQATLGPFDVLNLENRAMAGLFDELPDLTGTVVESDKPVVVFAGVDMTVIGDELPPGCSDPSDCNCCAEHVEQQVIPKTAMGKKYVVTRSPVRSSGGYIEPDYYRVMAAKDDTVVTTNLAEHPTFTLGELEWIEFKAKTGFVLEASKPVHVVQYLTAQQQCTDYIGDPALVPFPAVEERRPYYVFTTGINFARNYAVISMPDGFDATLDDADIASLCGPGDLTGELDGFTYRQYTCEIVEGSHVVDGGLQPVGVTVYGYYAAGSYGYPAGSNLTRIFLE